MNPSMNPPCSDEPLDEHFDEPFDEPISDEPLEKNDELLGQTHRAFNEPNPLWPDEPTVQPTVRSMNLFDEPLFFRV